MAKVKKNNTTKPVAQPKLSDLSQIHGAVDTPAVNKYTTSYEFTDASEYISYLEKLQTTDLQDHAIEKGEVPIEDRNRLIDRLHVRFLQVRAAAMPRVSVQMKIDPKREEAFRKIMAAAR